MFLGVMVSRVVRVASLLPGVCCALARLAAAQALPSARVCPDPVGLARAVSPGEVRVASNNPDGNGAASIRPTGRTVFYAPVLSPATAVAQLSDSGARSKPGTLHSGTSTEIAAADPRTTTTAKPRIRRARSWTVQVASFETIDEAQTMEQTLCTRGYEARIIGSNRPYEVRVGRYPSSDSALTVARRLTSRHLTVFVTSAE